MRRITVILTVMISAVYLAALRRLAADIDRNINTDSKHFIAAGPKVPQTLVIHQASITNDDAGADDTTEATSAATEGCWSKKPSLYDYPYSPTRSMRDWNRLCSQYGSPDGWRSDRARHPGTASSGIDSMEQS